MPLSEFDPIVQKWFTERFGSTTQPQALGWREVAGAPTGSGKTFAASCSVSIGWFVRHALKLCAMKHKWFMCRAESAWQRQSEKPQLAPRQKLPNWPSAKAIFFTDSHRGPSRLHFRCRNPRVQAWGSAITRIEISEPSAE